MTPTTTPRPAPPRPTHTTQQDLQASSQELAAEGRPNVSPFEIDLRTAVKRIGRLEARFDANEKRSKNTNVWTKYGTLGLGALYVAWPKIEIWGNAHGDLAYGLVGLGVSVVGALLLVMRAGQRSTGHDASNGGDWPQNGKDE